jgi:conjugal transfer pilus assembly protein TraD
MHKVLAPIMQPIGTITAREVEEDVLKVADILDLQQQEFYLMTYSGRYRGRVREVQPSRLKIRFPSAPVGIPIPGECEEAAEEAC